MGTMNIAILSTRSHRYHPNRRLIEAAAESGYSPLLLHPRRVRTGTPPDEAATWERQPRPDVLVPRIGSTIDEPELAAVFHLEQQGIPVVNGFDALVLGRDKFLSLRRLATLGIPVPQTFLVSESDQLAAAIRELGGLPVVVKALRGRQGTGIFLVEQDAFAHYLLEHPPRPREGILVQRFIASASCAGDVRIIVVGQRPVAVMKRIPPRGDFRSNVHLRGRGKPWSPSQDRLDLAARAATGLGLQVAGVDLLEGPDGPIVLEVNTTPGFREMERVTGLDVAKEIVDYAVTLARVRVAS
jgi:ribosomal protein S6--L-glutamate ligase